MLAASGVAPRAGDAREAKVAHHCATPRQSGHWPWRWIRLCGMKPAKEGAKMTHFEPGTIRPLAHE